MKLPAWPAVAAALICLSCQWSLAAWNEGYFMVEQRYRQTEIGLIAPESATNTALRFTIRRTAPTQTAVITHTNSMGGVLTIDPIADGTLVGAHYNKLFRFPNFGALTNFFNAGRYALALTRTYSGGNTVTLRPNYEFDGSNKIPTQSPIISNGTWSNGVMVLPATTLNVEWQPWLSPLNSNSAISIEIIKRGGGGAGGGIRSVYNAPITWGGLSPNSVYDCELQFMNVASKESLIDPQQGSGQEFRIVYATTTTFAVQTGASDSGGGGGGSIGGGVTKALISLYGPFTADVSKDPQTGRVHIGWFAEDKLKYRVVSSTNLSGWSSFGGEITGGGFDTSINFLPTNPSSFFKIERSGEHIIDAKYGAESTFADVTGVVAGLRQSSPNGFTVNNGTMGGDPIFGKVKTLIVRIAKFDGIYEYTAREGSFLDLRQ